MTKTQIPKRKPGWLYAGDSGSENIILVVDLNGEQYKLEGCSEYNPSTGQAIVFGYALGHIQLNPQSREFEEFEVTGVGQLAPHEKVPTRTAVYDMVVRRLVPKDY